MYAEVSNVRSRLTMGGHTATKVPGKKNMVTAAMAFIDALSRLLSSAKILDSYAILWLCSARVLESLAMLMLVF